MTEARSRATFVCSVFLSAFLSLSHCPEAHGFSTGQSADVVVGQPNMTSNSANQGGSPGANTFHSVEDAFGSASGLLAADLGNSRVLVFGTIPAANNAAANAAVGQPNLVTNTANIGGLGADTLCYPWYACTDGTRLFVSDAYNHRVLIYNTVPASSGVSADVVVGQPDMTSNCDNQCTTPGSRTLWFPSGICVSNSKLFVADTSNHRVLIFNSLPAANNAAADVVVGQPDMTSNSSGLAANRMAGPANVASDGTRLFVSELDNNRVLIFNSVPAANNAAADVVVGQANMTSNNYNYPFLSGSTLYHPRGVFSDGNRLFIADYANHRVLIFNSIPTVNNTAANIVLGQISLFLGYPNFPFLGADTLAYPRGVHFYNNKLIVADAGNNRVLIYYEPTPTSTPTLSPTPSVTPILSATPTYTVTPTATPTASRTHSPTASPTRSVTRTRTPTPTVTSSHTALPTSTPTHTATSSFTVTPTCSPTPFLNCTASPTVSNTLTRTATPSGGGPQPGNIRVYPNPFRPGQAAGHTLKIMGLAAADKISFYTLNGEKVFAAPGNVGGRLEWDGKNMQGSPVVAGYYFWVAERGDGSRVNGKLLIMK